MVKPAKPDYTLTRELTHFTGRFNCMASPCEILVDTLEKKLAAGIIETAVN
ncbi:MAG: hypothetical protein ACI845_000260, partial [Gammaproteobacteria bacterium]